MSRRAYFRVAISVLWVCHSALVSAQAPSGPANYIVTQRIAITAPVLRTVYRLGNKVVADQHPEDAANQRTRTFFDLETGKSLTWNPADLSSPCTADVFQAGGWQDPFSGGPDLAMKNVRHAGSEKVHGIEAEILESADLSVSGFRLWVDPATGLMLKAQFISKKLNTTTTYLEVTDVALTKPDSAVFEVPAICQSPAK